MWRMHLRSNLIQLLGAAKRRIHIVCIIEQRVVHLVFSGILSESDHMLEAMTPQDLGGQVTAASLRRHAGGLNDSLWNWKKYSVKTLSTFLLCLTYPTLQRSRIVPAAYPALTTHTTDYAGRSCATLSSAK